MPARPPMGDRTAVGAGWFEWSDDARRHLLGLQEHLEDSMVPRPVRAADTDTWTYEVQARPQPNTPAWEHVDALCGAFYRELRLPPEGMMCLRRVFAHDLDPRVVRSLFALLPHHIRHSNPRAAAYNVPIQPVAPEDSEFPLHSDLFAPSILCTIFDDVPPDETGGSVFMPVESLFCVLDECASMPSSVRAQVRSFFTDRDDHFDELVDLLHAPRHPWSTELARRLHERQLGMRFGFGEGYVLDDRRWLHGRGAQVRPVEMGRLCRVVFDIESNLAHDHPSATPVTQRPGSS